MEEDPDSLGAKTLFIGRIILACLLFFFLKTYEEAYFFTGSLNIFMATMFAMLRGSCFCPNFGEV